MFSIFKNKGKIKGLIGKFHLEEWWLNEFTELERKKIFEIFQPMVGEGRHILIDGDIDGVGDEPVTFFGALACWFLKEKYIDIAIKLITKADILLEENNLDILDQHFFYLNKITVYYRFRNFDEKFLEKAIEGCEQQISISELSKKAFLIEFKDDGLPLHTGYQQLSIIKEKKGSYIEAIKLCKAALNQGWNGDWEKRIERNEKKLLKI